MILDYLKRYDQSTSYQWPAPLTETWCVLIDDGPWLLQGCSDWNVTTVAPSHHATDQRRTVRSAGEEACFRPFSGQPWTWHLTTCARRHSAACRAHVDGTRRGRHLHLCIGIRHRLRHLGRIYRKLMFTTMPIFVWQILPIFSAGVNNQRSIFRGAKGGRVA